MRLFIFLTFVLLPISYAFEEVMAPRVHVVYDDPLVADYAQEVATQAEAALDILVTYFGEPKTRITIKLTNNSDYFNAFGSPLPRPLVSARALFPSDGLLGFGAKNELFLLLIHELTHVSHLTYTEGKQSPRLGLVGENTAQIPPMWFIEGIAVWIESEYTDGGRREDALTTGLLETLALSAEFPSLADVSLSSYEDWPGGNARYLLGVSFLQHLIKRDGIDAVIEVLRDYNSGSFLRTFSESWQRVTGADLETEWTTWREALKENAAASSQNLPETALTTTGWSTTAPTLSPDGRRLVWVSVPPKIVIADVAKNADGIELTNQRTVLDRRLPDTLEWLDDNTLLYSRLVRRPGTEYLELFSLDVSTGKETQLTEGARALFPNALPDGCILFVRDLPYEGSSLRTFCDGTITPFWQAPAGTHITGVDVSSSGKILISLWRDGATDIALLEEGELEFLTEDSFQDIHAAWTTEDSIVFSSNRSGRYELYALNLATKAQHLLTQLTLSPGAATQPSSRGGDVFYITLGAKGYDVAVTQTLGSFAVSSDNSLIELEGNAGVAEVEAPAPFAIRDYNPWPSLQPYGWLPSTFAVDVVAPFGLSFGVSLYGLDNSLTHSYSVNANYTTGLSGHLGGLSLYTYYEHNSNNVYTQLLPFYPASFGVLAGVWEHSAHLIGTTETALGFQTIFRVTYPLDRWIFRVNLVGGLLHLQSYGNIQPDFSFGVSLSQRSTDDWDYPTRGPRVSLTVVESATSEGPSFGVWGDATYYRALRLLGIDGTLELALRAGYRPTQDVPLELADWTAVGTVGYRVSLPLEWRWGDGRYALERVTLEPRVRPYVGSSAGLAADVALSADTILGYGAPTSFGVSFGYVQNNFWLTFTWSLPL
ncbi:MAG: hypothetical protein ACRCYY_04210 [Trueperaceae bacterium]